MDPRAVGLIGGVGGSVIGVLGGVVGTYFSVKNTSWSHERAFMIKMSALIWVAVTAFLAALWLTPQPYRPLLWLPYAPLLSLFIRACNRRQEQIRREESVRAARRPE